MTKLYYIKSCSNIIIKTCINTLYYKDNYLYNYIEHGSGGWVIKDEKCVFSSVTANQMNLKSGGKIAAQPRFGMKCDRCDNWWICHVTLEEGGV